MRFKIIGLLALIFVLLAFSASAQALCGNSVLDSDAGEECDDGNANERDGCSSECKITLTEKVYIIPYVGDIDGTISEDWFFFFKQMADFFDNNRLKAGFSFYPESLSDDLVFQDAFLKMYNSENIDLIHKGFVEGEKTDVFEKLSFEEQKEIIFNGQKDFIAWMESKGVDNVKLPVVYNQYQGRFSETTRNVLKELGFKFYLETYLPNDLAPVSSTENFAITQYGVGFSVSEEPGREFDFYSSSEIIKQINEFENGFDVLKIDDVIVLPLWVHQQDFEDEIIDNKINEKKWKIYTETLIRLRDDPNAIILSPEEAYGLWHGGNEENTEEDSEEQEDKKDTNDDANENGEPAGDENEEQQNENNETVNGKTNEQSDNNSTLNSGKTSTGKKKSSGSGKIEVRDLSKLPGSVIAEENAEIEEETNEKISFYNSVESGSVNDEKEDDDNFAAFFAVGNLEISLLLLLGLLLFLNYSIVSEGKLSGRRK